MMSGQERAEAGAIISFENESGQRLTLHRVGPIIQAVQEACALAMIHDESYRVVAVSSPSSIYADLAGRMPVKHGEGVPRYLYPEANIVGQAGLDALLHPRLQATTPQSQRRIRKAGRTRRARA
jgi:hypothetical protein